MPTARPTHDVIVVGLGGMGSAAACHLARRGLRVLGLDAFRPPHHLGSSHGSTRVIRQAYFEHPSYVPLLRRAYALWRDLEQASDRSLLLLPGGLMIGSPDSEVVSGSGRSATEHGIPHQWLDARELRRRFPPFRVPDDTVALFEPTAGLVWCERAVEAHLTLAIRHGADLRFDEPAISWTAGADAVEVASPRSRHEAGALILTPGPWAPALLRDLGWPLVVERQVMAWFDPPAGIAPFAPPDFPVFIRQAPDGSTPYGIPAVDGPKGGVKVALYHAPERVIVTPETTDRSVRNHDIAPLRAAIREFLPGLDGPLLHASTCLYTLTPDLHFVIDRHPVHPRVWVAAGFSGHGFKFCPVVGEILADLASGRHCPFDLSLFRVNRLTGA